MRRFSAPGRCSPPPRAIRPPSTASLYAESDETTALGFTVDPYVRDKDGSENYRLYDVDLETGVERDLTPLDDVQCRLIAHRKEFPNDVLIGLTILDASTR